MIEINQETTTVSGLERTFVLADGSLAGWVEESGAVSGSYPEITGYALEHCCAGLDGGLSPAAARSAASWLGEQVTAERWGPRPRREHVLYTFDLAVAASGLLAVGDRLSIPEAVEVATTACLRLADQVTVHGALRALDTAEQSGLADVSPRWSTHGSAHLVKCVQPLLRLADRSPECLRAAHILMAWGLERFETPEDLVVAGVTSLHAAAYTAEGFFMYGAFFDAPEYTERAADITRFIASARLENGFVPGFIGPARHADVRAAATGQTDASAQLLRLEALLGIRGTANERTASTLRSCRSDGGLVLYRPWSGKRDLNSWASMFAEQALAIHDGQQLESATDLV